MKGSPGVNHRNCVIILIITAVLWSSGGVLIKQLHWNTMAIAGSRSLIASLLILAIMKKPHFNWTFAQVGGALSYSATVIMFVVANKLTTASNAILLQYTSTIYVAILGALILKEKVKPVDCLTIFTTLGGVALFFMGGLTLDKMLGNIVAAASGLSFAFLVIFMRKQKDGSPSESILLGNIITAVAGMPFMFRSAPGASDIANLLVLGVLQLGLPYFLYSIAVKGVTAIEAVIIPIIEPVLSPVWVLIFMGEVPGKLSLIGGGIVLGSLALREVVVKYGMRKLQNTS